MFVTSWLLIELVSLQYKECLQIDKTNSPIEKMDKGDEVHKRGNKMGPGFTSSQGNIVCPEPWQETFIYQLGYKKFCMKLYTSKLTSRGFRG